ncbi:MAG: MoaD/ThiS family protein [Thermoprotei archaeon]|jgi:molybdopterin converting factor small subunit
MVVVRLYGWIRDRMGVKTIELNTSDVPLEQIIAMIDENGDVLKEVRDGTLFVAVNHEITNDMKKIIRSNDIVAIFPQFSGGHDG